jgi:hypothetical protein
MEKSGVLSYQTDPRPFQPLLMLNQHLLVEAMIVLASHVLKQVP